MTQLEIVKHERDSNAKASVERLEKLEKIEMNLRQELLILKRQNEESMEKNELKLDQYRETAKTKISKAEKDRKEMEVNLTSLRHNFSIKEAKWNMKLEQTENNITSLNEEQSRL